jgi:hypothetical protein
MLGAGRTSTACPDSDETSSRGRGRGTRLSGLGRSDVERAGARSSGSDRSGSTPASFAWEGLMILTQNLVGDMSSRLRWGLHHRWAWCAGTGSRRTRTGRWVGANHVRCEGGVVGALTIGLALEFVHRSCEGSGGMAARRRGETHVDTRPGLSWWNALGLLERCAVRARCGGCGFANDRAPG